MSKKQDLILMPNAIKKKGFGSNQPDSYPERNRRIYQVEIRKRNMFELIRLV